MAGEVSMLDNTPMALRISTHCPLPTYLRAATADQRWAWVPDQDLALVPAIIVGEAAATSKGKIRIKKEKRLLVRVRGSASHEIDVPESSIVDITNPLSLDALSDDLVKMDEVNVGTILHNLRERFKEDAFYTSLGTILISVNPFKWVTEIYTNDVMEYYQSMRDTGLETPPHIYAIAEAAVCGIIDSGANQSIICSGESGAGKTEAAKKCLEYLGFVAGSVSGIEKKILAASPVLEAFGNAKTLRNNNSSRFGKWMEIHFGATRAILGCSNVNYLLEKTRVVRQDAGERNYHIFYQIISGMPAAEREQFHLSGNPHDYFYTNQSGCTTIDGKPEEGEYQEMRESMTQLGWSDTEVHAIFQVLSGILHLGNVLFNEENGGEASSVSNRDAIAVSASMFEVDPDMLASALTTHTITTGSLRGSIIRTQHNVDDAADTRDALSKAVYDKMFNWLVQRVNQSVSFSEESQNVIGILDIFGFEIFEMNSFEQLCINYANEKLQQHFNRNTFKLETEVYASEGIEYEEIVFNDNQDVLDLISTKRTGLLQMLDEEIRVPRGSSITFFNKFVKKHAKDVRLSCAPGQKDFIINHYAGPVKYEPKGFLEKNKDTLFMDLETCMKRSSLPFLAMLFGEQTAAKATEDASAVKPGRMRRQGSSGGTSKITVGGHFNSQLEALMSTLYSTIPQYVRCIKGNSVKKADIFESPLVLEQLKYSGVFEAVKIRKQGFPFRRTHKHFRQRYHMLMPKGQAKLLSGSPIQQAKMLVKKLEEQEPEIMGGGNTKFGRTMVLYRAPQQRLLEKWRATEIALATIMCQKAVKGQQARKRVAEIRKCTPMMKEAMRERSLPKLKKACAFSTELLKMLKAINVTSITFPLYPDCMAMCARLEKEIALNNKLEELSKLDPLECYDQLKACVEEADELEMDERVYPAVTRGRVAKKSVEDVMEAKNGLRNGAQTYDLALLESSIQLASKLTQSGRINRDFYANELKMAEAALSIVKEEHGKCLNELQDAVRTGAVAVSNDGTAEISMVTTVSLQTVLDQYGHIEAKTPEVKKLLWTAKWLLEVRQALKDETWEIVGRACQKLMDEKTRENSVAATAKDEVDIIRDMYNVRTIVPEMKVALMENKALLPVPLSCDSLSTEKLDEVIAKATQIRVMTKEAKMLNRSAVIIRDLRRVLQKRVEEKTDEVDSLEAALRAVSSAELEAGFTLAPEATQEIADAKMEVMYHRSLNAMANAMCEGGVGGVVGRLDTTFTDIGPLEAALRDASNVKSEHQDIQRLRSACEFMVKLRRSVQVQDFNQAEQILEGKAMAGLARREKKPVGKKGNLLRWQSLAFTETSLVQDEINNINIIKALTAAVGAGMMSGEVGAVQMSTIAVQTLSTGLDLSQTLGCKTAEATLLRSTAVVLLSLRSALLEGNWDRVRLCLYESTTGKLAGMENILGGRKEAPELSPLVVEEMELARDEANDRAMCEAMTSSLLSGMATGGIGRMSIGGVDVAKLDKAIATAEDLGTKSNNAFMLLGSCHAMRNLRAALMANEWEEVKRCVGVCDSRGVDGDKNSLLKKCVPEVRFVEGEYRDRWTRRELPLALQRGMASGTTGRFVTQSVSLADLDPRINTVSGWSCKTDEAAQLLRTAQIIKKLRGALMQGEWDAVEKIVYRAPQENLSVLASTEIQAAKDEVEDRNIKSTLTAALTSGFATGRVGDIDTSTVNHSVVSDGIAVTQKLGCKTTEAQLLLDTSQIVLRIRKALKASDWDGVGAGIGDADRVGLSNISSLSLKEIQFARDERNDLIMVGEMEAAIRAGMATGSVGHMNTLSIEVGGVDAAIDHATSLGTKSPNADGLLITCRLLKRLRQALLAGDWDEIMNVLENSHEVHVPLSDLSVDEFKFAKDELDDRTIREEIEYALQDGMASGVIGDIDIATVDLSKLQEVILLAEDLGCKSHEARQALHTAKVVLEARKALKASSPLDVDRAQIVSDIQSNKIDQVARAELNFAVDERDNFLITSTLKEAISSGKPSGSVGDFSTGTIVTQALDDGIAIGTKLTTKTKLAATLMSTAKIIRHLRLALLSKSWEEAREVIDEAEKQNAGSDGNGMGQLYEDAMDEIVFVRDEYRDRWCKKEIPYALQRGMATGAPGRMNVTTVTLSDLDPRIKTVKMWGTNTPESELLLRTAELVRALRQAIINSEWEQIEDVLLRARELNTSQISQKEFDSATDEVNNRNIIFALESALKEGMATGMIGDFDLSTVVVTDLERGIELAKALTCKTQEAKSLFRTATVVLDVRLALEQADWETVGSAVAQADSGPVHILARDEIEFARDERNNMLMIEEMTTALLNGMASGEVGHLDTNTIDVSELDRAIMKAEDLTAKSENAQQLLRSARGIRRLRGALLRQETELVSMVLSELEHIDLVAFVKTEITFAQDDLNDTLVRKELEYSVSIGKATGSVGRLVPSSADTSRLETGIAKALNLPRMSPENESLLNLAHCLRSLRLALSAEEWDAMPGMMNDIMGHTNAETLKLPKPLPSAVVTELRVYQDELENRTILHELRSALTHGKATGPPGELDRSTIDVNELEMSISHAQELRCKTPNAKNLLQIARIMKGMRDALSAGKWGTVEQSLARANVFLEQKRGKGQIGAASRSAHNGEHVLDIVVGEIEHAQDEVNDRTIMNILTSAVNTGKASGPPGEFRKSTIMIAKLESAITRAQGIGCKSKLSIQLLASAKAVLSLRQALSSNPSDWVEADELLNSTPIDTMSTLVVEEFHHARLESNDIRVVRAMKAAVAKGMATGAVGEMNLLGVDVQPLKAALEFSKELGCLSKESKQLLLTCQLTLRLRHSLLADAWRSNFGTGENGSTLAVGEGDNMSMHERDCVENVLNDARDAKEVSSAASSGGMGQTNWRSSVNLSSERYSSRTGSANFRGLHVTAQAEFKAAKFELDNHIILTDLTEALRVGAATGMAGEINKDTIEMKALHAQIQTATSLVCRSVKAKHLLKTAEYVLKIRAAMRGGAWTELGDILARMNIKSTAGNNNHLASTSDATFVPAEVSFEELRLAKEEFHFRTVLALLEKALARGSAAGVCGSLNLSTINVSLLESTVAEHAPSPDLQSPEGLRLIKTFKTMRTLRIAMRSDEWSTCEKVSRDALETIKLDEKMGRPKMLGLGLDEIRIAYDECIDRRTRANLLLCLGKGMMTGSVGNFQMASIKIDDLDDAISMCREHGFKTVQAQRLVKVAEVIRELRLSLLDEAWGRTKDALADAKRELSSPQVEDKTRECVANELQMAQYAVEDVEIQRSLNRALATGMATGSVGSMETATVSLVELNPAIANAEKLKCRSEAAMSLMVSARIVQKLRNAWLRGDQALMETALKEATAVGAEISDIVSDEVQAAEDEFANRAVVEALTESLRKMLSLDKPEESSVGNLNTAIANAKTLRRMSVQTQSLLRSASIVANLASGDSSGIDMTENLAELDECIENAMKYMKRSDEAEKLLRSAKFIRQLQVAREKEQWEIIRDVLAQAHKQGYVAQIGSQIEEAQTEYDNHIVCTGFTAALSQDMAVGDVGRLDCSKISISQLDTALTCATRLGITTDEAKVLNFTAKMARKMRFALASDDWEETERILLLTAEGPDFIGQIGDGEETSSAVLPPWPPEWPPEEEDLADVAIDEFTSAILEVNDRKIRSLLLEGLESGTAKGMTGAMDTSYINIKKLHKGIELAKSLGVVSPEAKCLLTTAELMEQLRQALRKREWVAIQAILQETDATEVSGVADAEILAARMELHHTLIVSELTRALSIGMATGDLQKVVVNTIDTAELAAAIGHTKVLKCDSIVSKLYLETAKIVCKLREAQQGLRWDVVEQLLDQCDANHTHIVEIASAEVQFARQYVENRKMVDSLRSAVATGAPMTVKGELHTEMISVSGLQSSIDAAQSVGAHTEEAQHLLASAETLKQLRLALQRKDWRLVSQYVAEARSQGLAEAAAGDIAAAEKALQGHNNTVDLRAVVWAAATQMSLEFCLDDEDVSKLDEAIALASSLDLSQQELSMLLLTAKILREMGVALATQIANGAINTSSSSIAAHADLFVDAVDKYYGLGALLQTAFQGDLGLSRSQLVALVKLLRAHHELAPSAATVKCCSIAENGLSAYIQKHQKGGKATGGKTLPESTPESRARRGMTTGMMSNGNTAMNRDNAQAASNGRYKY
jgi:myosin heavy subunit/predicted kinase